MTPSVARLRPFRPWLSGIIAAALFGLSTPAAKQLVGGTGPLRLAGLLYLGAAIFVLPVAIKQPRGATILDRRNRYRLAGAILFGGILGPVLLLLGLRAAPSSSVSLWLNLEMPATALLAWLLFHEHLGMRLVAAAGLIVLGGVLLSSPEGFSLGLPGVLVLAACLCWGLDNNMTSLIDGLSPARTTVIKGIVAGTVNLTLGLFLEPGGLDGSWTYALAVGGLGYGLSLVLYVSSAQALQAVRSQMIFSSAPLFGLVAAWGWLGESLQGVQALAVATMGLGVGLLFWEKHLHFHEHEEMEHVHAHRHDDGHHGHSHAPSSSVILSGAHGR